jgi:hypothetical protein
MLRFTRGMCCITPVSNSQLTALSFCELPVADSGTAIGLKTHAALQALACIALLALTGCGGGSGSTDSVPASALASIRPVTQSDLEIAQLLYADTERTPSGFYAETQPVVQGYVSVAHLKNTDLTGALTGVQYELCTDDWNTALAWSEQVATAQQLSSLVETNTTTRYYEFVHTRSGTPIGYVHSRVYRCTYLDRSAVDLRSNANTVAGTLNLRPITATDLQQLSEYLWQYTTYNNYGNAVLKSSAATISNGFQQTLIIASMTPATSGSCDHVQVIGWSHSVNAQTGALTNAIEPLWDFGAQRTAGVVTMCNPN